MLAEAQFAEIYMQTVDIRPTLVEPAGCAVNKATVVDGFQFPVSVVGAELPPAFVKNSPQTDAGVILQQTNRFLHRIQKNSARFGIRVQPPVGTLFYMDGGENGIPEVAVFSIVDHILEDNHPEPVTVVVEPFGFQFNMFAQRIETQGLHGEDVFFKCLRHGRGIKTVAPIALVQQPVEEVRFAVQAEARNAVNRFRAQGAEGKVRFNTVFSA